MCQEAFQQRSVNRCVNFTSDRLSSHPAVIMADVCAGQQNLKAGQCNAYRWLTTTWFAPKQAL